MGRSLTVRLAGFCGRLSPRFRSESEATPLKKIPKGLSEPYQSPLTTYEFASEKRTNIGKAEMFSWNLTGEVMSPERVFSCMTLHVC